MVRTVARASLVVLGLAGALALVPACGSNGSEETTGEAAQPSPLGIPTQPATDSNAGFAAVIAGAVVFDEETGCVFVESGQATYPVVWPTGTTAQRDPFELRLPDGSIAVEGDRIEGGGGYLGGPELGEGAAETLAELGVPGACRQEEDEVAVLNANWAVAVVKQER